MPTTFTSIADIWHKHQAESKTKAREDAQSNLECRICQAINKISKATTVKHIDYMFNTEENAWEELAFKHPRLFLDRLVPVKHKLNMLRVIKNGFPTTIGDMLKNDKSLKCNKCAVFEVRGLGIWTCSFWADQTIIPMVVSSLEDTTELYMHPLSKKVQAWLESE